MDLTAVERLRRAYAEEGVIPAHLQTSLERLCKPGRTQEKRLVQEPGGGKEGKVQGNADK